MNHFDYYKPQSLKEIWDLRKKIPGARYIAGGTDLLVQIKNREITPEALISLRSIPEMHGIKMGKVCRIGSTTPIADLIKHPELGNTYPVLIQAAKKIGSTQIRNMGTVGGNLCNCSPSADTALPFLVLDARAVLKNPEGSREIPLKDFFLGPGESCLSTDEILTELLLEKPGPYIKAKFLKKGRVKLDLSIASVAVLLEMDGKTCKKARVAVGSVAPVPMRLNRVEERLKNEVISKKILQEAQQIAKKSVSPITDIRSTADYRREIVAVYIKRIIQELVNGDIK